jgi:hypothetical protein
MSDQTHGPLARAEAGAEAERARSERLAQELLDRIAAGVPAAVDAIARRAAEAQPDVTRKLGSEGIRAMRGELAERSAGLAGEIRAASAEIEWPLEEAVRYGEVRTRHLDAALFRYLHGPRMNAIAEVLQDHGYGTAGDGATPAQELINPHDLYVEQWLSPLAEARTSLSVAENSVRAAQQTDDQATVRSIWDRS